MNNEPTEGPGNAAWILIPARGGSKGVPRKNLRLIAGSPLISFTIRAAMSVVAPSRVAVITDDLEIRTVAESLGCVVLFEDVPTPDEETLDEKIIRNIPRLLGLGASPEDVVITVQPTSPGLTGTSIQKAIDLLQKGSCQSAISVTDDRHLRWIRDDQLRAKPAYVDRVNRQQLPMEFRETGGIIGARLSAILDNGTRVVPPVELIELDARESVDIDTFADLYMAAHFLTNLKVAVRADSYKGIGMGHVYRANAISLELARHDVKVYTKNNTIGHHFLASRGVQTVAVRSEADFVALLKQDPPDLVILDILDTSIEFVEAIRGASMGAKVVTFEDLGPGSAVTDLVVCEFVQNEFVPRDRQLTGLANSVLAPSFDFIDHLRSPDCKSPVASRVDDVLVLFGGTDPAHLALRVIDSLTRLQFDGRVTVVRGLGADRLDVDGLSSDTPFSLEVLVDVAYMPGVMAGRQVAFTSAGRTIIELASMGIPSICLAQNEREMSHSHATRDNGVMMLGRGSEVPDVVLDAAVSEVLRNHELRQALHCNALSSMQGRSNRRTIAHILEFLGFDPFPNL